MIATKRKAKDKFKFVNFTNRRDARESKVRTQVRSQASRWQHSQSIARLHAALAPDHDIDSSASEKFKNSSNASNSNILVNVADPPISPDLAERREAIYEQHDYFPQDSDGTDTGTTIFTPEACRFASERALASFSRGVMSFRTIALEDSQNIIGTGLKVMRLELSSVMGLYKNICGIQAADFARQYGIGGDQAFCGRFYAFVYTDLILLSTAVFLGARNQLDVFGRCIHGQVFASVLQIERFLMRSINEALGDPVRGISDQMLIAVALCAAYKTKNRTGACYHICMRGLVQMVHPRGGLLAIGSTDPYIVRLLI